MLPAVRIIIVALAGLFFLGGLGGVASGAIPAPSALWLMAIGAAGVIVIVLERARYGTDAGASPAGGDPRPTGEVFVDPTTGQRTRVWIDPASGERTYRVDGQ